MSQRNESRFARTRACSFALAVTFGLLGAASAMAETAADAPKAIDKAANTLESLKELDGKAPARRSLNIQSWNTAEGARVLFVEAHELPMFDMRLLFAAGSSQDGANPGIALVTDRKSVV